MNASGTSTHFPNSPITARPSGDDEDGTVVGDREGQSQDNATNRLTTPTSQSLDVSLNRGFPVPQIIITYNMLSLAWGRQTLIQLGYEKTIKLLAETFIPDFKAQLKFKKQASLMATFYVTHGYRDEVPVRLQPFGWSELISNVVTIDIIFSQD
ncbi:hypothetical protein C8Q75DRAFT_314575 [Abortiporus biennis]|nr:hypothetical protein C8Q75DRAFT_314575 [Abortiporus biennis]